MVDANAERVADADRLVEYWEDQVKNYEKNLRWARGQLNTAKARAKDARKEK